MSGHGMLLALVATVCASTSAMAQATTATLQGTVVDPNHGVLFGATVDVRSRETGAVRHAAVGADGGYRITGLIPGVYEITARALGFRPERRSAVELLVGE